MSDISGNWVDKEEMKFRPVVPNRTVQTPTKIPQEVSSGKRSSSIIMLQIIS